MVWLSTTACIESYDYPFEEQNNYLVVEGAVTTEEGPQVVTLTTTRNISNKDNNFKLRVQGARVSVVTSSGHSERMVELDTTGMYYSSPGFRGVPGEAYQLQIVLPDGRQYVSEMVPLNAAPGIDSLGIEYASQRHLTENNTQVTATGFKIYAHVDDPAGESNFYVANWEFTYKVFTHPELATTFDQDCNCYVPAPQSCCSVCWIEEKLPDFTVFNDRFSNGQQTQYPLFFLPVLGKMFYDRIYVKAKIYSLNEDAYLFWKAIYDSRYSQGGLFDPAPNTIASNIANVADENELVLGYFYASDVKSAERYIKPAEFPERIDYDTGFPNSCTMLEKSTAEKPDYWDE